MWIEQVLVPRCAQPGKNVGSVRHMDADVSTIWTCFEDNRKNVQFLLQLNEELAGVFCAQCEEVFCSSVDLNFMWKAKAIMLILIVQLKYDWTWARAQPNTYCDIYFRHACESMILVHAVRP